MCDQLLYYDWVSVPLVYTQVRYACVIIIIINTYYGAPQPVPRRASQYKLKIKKKYMKK